jgi:hypothetical protein
MLEEFPIKFAEDERQETPASNSLLEEGKGKLLEENRKEVYHSFMAKGIFVSKRARTDIHPTVTVLSTRVKGPKETDWKKLVRMMRYLHTTKGLYLTLYAYDISKGVWYVDASFAVHPDYKSHTGGVLIMGRGPGALQVLSKKQKLNSRSSTEAELIGVDDAMVIWTHLFFKEQGYPLKKNILMQDNKSAILLEKNGRKSAGKRSRAINIRYFYITDQVEQGNVEIQYCPTDEMVGDFMTKPLQGEKFRKFRRIILGLDEE